MKDPYSGVDEDALAEEWGPGLGFPILLGLICWLVLIAAVVLVLR